MKTIRSTLSALLFSLFCLRAQAKPYYDYDTSLQFREADAVVAGVNAGIGCAFGAVPALIRNRGIRAVAENCLEGMVAGSFIYVGEKAASLANNPGLGWTGHAFVGLGASMRENIARGYNPFSRVTYDLGPLRLSAGAPEANAGKVLQWYLLPGSIAGIVANLAYGNKWNPRATVYSGTIVFDAYREGDFVGDDLFVGKVIGNVITMNHAIGMYDLQGRIFYYAPGNLKVFALVYAHEQVHAVQNRAWGSVDLVLRLSERYQRFIECTRLDFSSDIGVSAAFVASAPFDLALTEWTPRMLTAERADVLRIGMKGE